MACIDVVSAAEGRVRSLNWAGYVVPGTRVSAVAAAWTVPEVFSPPETGYVAAWVGIGGFDTGDLIQIGTMQALVRGQPRYTAWWETLPGPMIPIALAVRPGDAVEGAVRQQGLCRWTVSLTNLTTGRSFEQTVWYGSSRSSAEWIVEAPTNLFRRLPLAGFRAVAFRAARVTADGVTGSIAARPHAAVQMIDQAGNVIVDVSPLSPDGTAFTVHPVPVPMGRPDGALRNPAIASG